MERTEAQNLEVGETILENVRKVSNEKFQIEVGERLPQSNSNSDLIQMLNPSAAGGASIRRAWQPGEYEATKQMIEKIIGEEFELPQEEGESKYIGFKNPTLNGHKLGVRVKETTRPDSYQAENPESTCKRAGKDGPKLHHDGKLIFSNTYVVMDKKTGSDVFLKHDEELTQASNEPIVEGSSAEVEGASAEATGDTDS